MMPSKPILEVNPTHKLIEALSAKLENTALIEEAAATLLDLAQVQEGDLPADASGVRAAGDDAAGRQHRVGCVGMGGP